MAVRYARHYQGDGASAIVNGGKGRPIPRRSRKVGDVDDFRLVAGCRAQHVSVSNGMCVWSVK